MPSYFCSDQEVEGDGGMSAPGQQVKLNRDSDSAGGGVVQLAQCVKYNLSTDLPPGATFLAVNRHFPLQVSFYTASRDLTIQGDHF